MSTPRRFSRRAFLKLTAGTAITTASLGAGGYVYAKQIEPGSIEVTTVALALPRLASAFDGYRLVQISDIHMDASFMSGERLRPITLLVMEQQPDLVAITGDFVSSESPVGFADAMVYALQPLASAPDGVVAVLGNHDHWTDADAVRAVLEGSGIADLSNAVQTLRRGDAMLHIAGVDDIWEQHDRLDLVLDQLPAEGAAVLLAHEPDFADTSAVTGRFDVQLSGHSHGGQVNIPLVGRPVLPPYGRKYPAGLYQVGEMLQYTNRGLGMIHPQVRFNCRPEITVFTLHSL